nr:hypothetical protein [Tanacetum cinerariifolium]
MDQDQIERDAEVALKIQADLNEEAKTKRERQEEASKADLAEMYDEVQEQIDADHELAVRLTLEEKEKQDVLDLHKIIMERFPANDPKGYDLILWGDMKTLVESSEDDEIWRNQQD